MINFETHHFLHERALGDSGEKSVDNSDDIIDDSINTQSKTLIANNAGQKLFCYCHNSAYIQYISKLFLKLANC